jgi:tetratricopeptide (TPR) repeat protein
MDEGWPPTDGVKDLFLDLEAGVQTAEDLISAGSYSAALTCYQDLLRKRLESVENGSASFVSADLVIIERLAELSTLFGLFEAADSLLQAMVALCREANNELAGDYAHMKRVELAFARGQVQESFSLLRELKDNIGDLENIEMSIGGLKCWEASIKWRQFAAADCVILLTRAYLIMGQILSALGRYSDAIAMLMRGLSHAQGEDAPDLVRRTGSVMSLAHMAALLEKGDLNEAERALVALAPDQDDVLAPATRTRRLELAGKLDMLRGRLSSAVLHFEEVIQFCQHRGFVRASCAAALNLAHIFILLNRIGDALRLVEEARQAAMQLHDHGLGLRAIAIASLAFARRRSPAAAVSIALSVTEMVRARSTQSGETKHSMPPLPILPQADNFLQFFEDRALEFQWALGTDPDEAEWRLKAIREAFSQTDSRLIRARVPMLEGLLHFARENFDAALTSFGVAADEYSVLSLKPELWQVLYLRARCFDRIGRNEEARQHSEAAEALLLELAGSLGGSDRAIFLLNKATVEEQHIQDQVHALLCEQEEVGKAHGFVRLRGHVRLMRRIHTLMEHLDSYKAGLADRQVTGTSIGPSLQGVKAATSWSFLRRLLCIPRDRTLLSFLVLADQLVVLRSGFLALGFSVSPVTRLDLRERVRRWHELMHGTVASIRRDLAANEESPSAPSPEDVETCITELVDALQLDAILAALPNRVRALSIIPDDVLHGVPFAALKHQGRYLVEKFTLSIGFTTQPCERTQHTARGSGLVIGVSRGDGDLLPELPKVIVESEAVVAWLKSQQIQVRILIDKEANRAAVLEGLSQAALTHIACHGTFEPDRPDRSGIVLVPEVGRSERVTLRDISAVRLKGCHLVTLSSCWSADNFILPGRWIISLPETLWRRGAKSVLGSLWPLDDDVASAFMSRFYSNLGRLPREAALREAQLASLANELNCRRTGSIDTIDTGDPFYWAGATLYGQPGPLRI